MNEGRVLVRHAHGVGRTGNDVAVGHAVVERANLQDVGHLAQVVRQRDLDAVAAIDRRAVGTVPGIGLVDAVRFQAVEDDARGEIVTVHAHVQRRRLDHGGILQRHRPGQPLRVGAESELDLAVRAGDLDLLHGHHPLGAPRLRLALSLAFLLSLLLGQATSGPDRRRCVHDSVPRRLPCSMRLLCMMSTPVAGPHLRLTI